jgi:hypothetical protein
MSWLTTSSSSVLDLKVIINLLKILGTLKSELKTLEGKNVIEILELLGQDEVSLEKQLGEALDKISHQTVEELTARWAELRTKLDDPRIKKLRSLSHTFQELHHQDALPNIIDWRIFNLDEDQSKTPNSHIKLKLTAGANAAIDMEANAKLPKDIAQPSREKAVFRCGFDGNMTLGTELSSTVDILDIGIGGSADGKVEMDFYFLEERTANFGLAAAENLTQLVECSNGPCSPLDVRKMQSLITKADLYCVKFTAESNLQLKASLGIGKRFDAADKVKAKVGVAIDYMAIETGLFDYQFTQYQADAEDCIAVQIKRSNEDEKTLSQSFKLDFDTSRVAKHLLDVMDEHFGDANEAIEELRDLLPGSDFIRSKLESVIDQKLADDTLRGQIKSLLGFTPGKAPEIVLRDRIIDAIEGKTEKWADDSEKAVNTVLAEISREVPLLVNLIPQLREAITEAIQEKRKQLSIKIAEKVTSATAYKAIVAKLQKAGARISETIAGKDKRIAAASKAAEDLLNRVQNVINKADTLLKKAAEKKITLGVFSERKSNTKEGLDLSFNLFPSREGAQKAVDAILLGDMGKLMDIIRENTATPETAPIKDGSGDYQLFEKLTSTGGSEIVLFDVKLGTKSIIDAEVDWRMDVAGNISVVSRAEFKRINYGRGESRTVRIVESSEMLFASKKSALTLGITISHEDDDLKVNEATGFLSRLIERKLLPESASTDADSLVKSLSNKNAIKGRIDVGVTFTKDQIHALASHVIAMRTETTCLVNTQSRSVEPCERPSVHCFDERLHPGCRDFMDTVSGILAKVLTEQLEKNELDRLKRLIEVHELTNVKEAIKVMTPEEVAKYRHEWEYDEVRTDLFPRFVTEPDHDSMLFFLESRRYGALAVYEMIAHIKALLETEFSDDGMLQGWTPSALKAHQYRIGQVMSNWWQWDREWKQTLFLSDKMRVLSVALFETLVTLGQTPPGNRPTVWVTISLPDPASGALVPKKLVAG